MSNRVTASVVFLCSGLILLTSALHGIVGFGSIERELERLDASPDLVAALGIGWALGSLCWATLGVLTALAARRLLRGDRSLWAPALMIGSLYGLFGIGAIVLRGFSAHFLLFVGIGALLVGALWAARPPSADD